jgi:hypothetical protein
LKRVVVVIVNGDLPLLCSLLENNQFFDWNETVRFGASGTTMSANLFELQIKRVKHYVI